MQSRTVSVVHKKTLKLALSYTALLSLAEKLQIPGIHQGLHKPIQDPTCALSSLDHAPRKWLLSEGTITTAVILESPRGSVLPWTVLKVYSYLSLKVCT